MSFIGYPSLDDNAAECEIRQLGRWVLINGELTMAIFKYPTEEQVIGRMGRDASAKSISPLLRIPELHLHRRSGTFQQAQPVRVLCFHAEWRKQFVAAVKTYTGETLEQALSELDAVKPDLSVGDFVLGEFFYSDSAMYRVTLNEDQPAPVDTEGRGWR